MYKQVLILLVAVSAVACELTISNEADEVPYVVEGPVDVVPAAPHANQPAAVEGRRTNFSGHLKDLLATGRDHAQKAFNEARPALDGLREDLKESVENLKKNPHVAKGLEVAGTHLNAAKDKSRPLIEAGGKKIGAVWSKIQDRRNARNGAKQPIAEVAE